MSTLATFGCSWVSGPGSFKGINTFGQQLAEKLGTTKFLNLGIEGTSNSRSVLQLIDYVKRTDIEIKNSTAIFLITTPSRDCLIKHSIDAIIDLRGDSNNELTKFWLEHFCSFENERFGLHKNILSMQSICKQYCINDYYMVAWSDLDLDLPGVDVSKIYPKTCVQLFGFQGMCDYLNSAPLGQFSHPYLRGCGHPNDQGNQLIAQTLFDWISHNHA